MSISLEQQNIGRILKQRQHSQMLSACRHIRRCCKPQDKELGAAQGAGCSQQGQGQPQALAQWSAEVKQKEAAESRCTCE